MVSTSPVRRAFAILVMALGITCAGGGAMASAATVDVSSTSGPPGSKVSVSGTGFAANGIVEIYFDTAQVAFAVTDGSGEFGPRSIKVPSSADPGTHFVTVKNADAPGGGEHFYTVRTDWPQHRTGALRRGYNGHENVINPGNVGNLEEAWTAATVGPSFSTGSSAPVTGGGTLFFTSESSIAGVGSRLDAYTIGTRSLLWSRAFPTAVRAAPAWANSHVYVSVSGGGGNPAQLQSRSASTGGLEWKGLFTIAHAAQGAAPAVSAGVVYATFRSSANTTGVLSAFGATCGTGGATCTPLWQGSLGSGFGFTGSPLVAKGRVFAVGADSMLYAFAVGCGTGGATCSPQWASSVPVQSSSTPAYSNGLVYIVGNDAHVHAYRARGCGASACSPVFRLTGPVSGSPAVAGGMVYAHSSGEGFLKAYPALCSASTCTHRWRGPTGPESVGFPPSPIVANGVVYVPSASGGGAVHAFAVGCGAGGATCSSLLDANIDDPGIVPAVADGVLYVGTDGPFIHAFDLPSASVAARPRAPSLRSLRPSRRLERQARRALSRLTGGAVAGS